MAGKLCLQSQKDIERMLEDSASGDDDVSSESDKVQNLKVVVTVKLKIHTQVTVILRHQREKLERERVGSGV